MSFRLAKVFSGHELEKIKLSLKSNENIFIGQFQFAFKILKKIWTANMFARRIPLCNPFFVWF